MSMPLENHEPQNHEEDRLLDRLVDGELSDVERRKLLVRLETEPNGWRECALAFLEAQSWREALGPGWSAGLSGSRPLAAAPATRAGVPTYRRPIVKLTALAACLAVAFALGWVSHDESTKEKFHATLARVESPGPMATVERPTPPAPALTSQASVPIESSAVLEPVVKQWEQHGYRADTQKRLVSMQLKDGERLHLQVHEVRLHYVGDRTY